MHLQNNTLLQGGKYKIVRFIKSGGFGCTYEAEHVMLRKKVAIKEFFVKDFCNRDEKTLQITVGITAKIPLVKKLKKKFVEEAQSLCSLDHPNIVRISDVFEENGTAYYVMDYIDGSSLQDLVNKRGSLPESEAVVYIRQVADALKYVHSLNRLHLDIKPGNIMVDNKGRAILIDFGTAKQYDEEAGENTSTLLGKTPGYAPLEQMGNDVVKFLPSTDIYALGATLYNLLTGVTPPSASLLASGETLEIPTSLSAYTRNAILQSMQINKMKRPQSIDEFLDLFASSKDESTIIEDDEEDTFVNNESTRTDASAWQEEEARRQREFKAKAEREAKASEEARYHAEESEQNSREETVRSTFEEERTRPVEPIKREEVKKNINDKSYKLIIGIACAAILGLFAWLFTSLPSENKQSAHNKLNNELDSVAYAYGAVYGRQYSNFSDPDNVMPGATMNVDQFLAGFIPAIRRDEVNMPFTSDGAEQIMSDFQTFYKNIDGNITLSNKYYDTTNFSCERMANAYGVKFGTEFSNFQDISEVVPGKKMNLDLFIEAFSKAIHKDTLDMYFLPGFANDYLSEFNTRLKSLIAQKQESDIATEKARGLEYLAKNAIKEGVVKLQSGVQIQTVRQGYGKQPKEGNMVLVNYVGTLIDGTQFDSNENIEFNVNNVVKGFKEGLLHMSEGEKAIITIPSDLAYGDKGVGQDIPGGSTLIFEVELLRVRR